MSREITSTTKYIDGKKWVTVEYPDGTKVTLREFKKFNEPKKKE